MIYLDNAATTAVCDEAVKAANEGFECFGNPSSLHGAGLKAENIIRNARGEIAPLGGRADKGAGGAWL